MKNKKVLICTMIIIFILIISILMYYFMSLKKQFPRIDEVYSVSYQMVEQCKKSDIALLNNTEKAIYNYFENISNEINEVSNRSYEKYISEKTNNDFYSNIENVSDDIKKSKDLEEEMIKKIEELSKEKNFIKYLKENKVNFVYVNYLKNKISNEIIFTVEKVLENISSDKEKYDMLIKYVDYLNEHRESWKYKDNKIISNNVDVLNFIKEKDKELGLNIKVVMSERSNKNIPVLMYHGVSDTTWGIENLFMRVDDFEKQLKYIHDNYETIFIEDIEDYYGDAKVVALTFDDGYEDFYRNVLPLLKKYNLKANLYIIVGNKGGYFLTDEQILEINNSGLVSIGSHTVKHSDLTHLSKEELDIELKDSKESIEKLLGKEIKTICYPAGAHNDMVLEETSKYYEYGLIIGGTVETMNDNFNKVAIKRYRVYRNTGFDRVKKMIDSAS